LTILVSPAVTPHMLWSNVEKATQHKSRRRSNSWPCWRPQEITHVNKNANFRNVHGINISKNKLYRETGLKWDEVCDSLGESISEFVCVSCMCGRGLLPRHQLATYGVLPCVGTPARMWDSHIHRGIHEYKGIPHTPYIYIYIHRYIYIYIYTCIYVHMYICIND
jgi:hypothetical protein